MPRRTRSRPGSTRTDAEPDHPGAAVAALLEGHWYDAVAELLARSLPRIDGVDEGGAGDGTDPLRRAYRLATAARRVLDLDAEDFGDIAADLRGVGRGGAGERDGAGERGGAAQSDWAYRLISCRFPLRPDEEQRGALGSLVPLYELMLEVLQLRAVRREPLQVVVTVHLIGEYLAQLAWESTLGHAGDPLRMAASVDRIPGVEPQSRWGIDGSGCPHSSALRATAKRSLNACAGDHVGYTAYLDRFHSRLGDALAVCAINHETIGPGRRPDVGDSCATPCAFAVRGPLERRRDLDARVRLALTYVDSPVVALRHHAPVGHFFGVPSAHEISAAWERTWERLTAAWNDGANPLQDLDDGLRRETDEALPGMAALVSAVAGRPIGAGRVIRDIGAEITHTLGGAA